MKLLISIFILSSFSLYESNSNSPLEKWAPPKFQYSDTTFYLWQTRNIQIEYNMDNGRILPKSEKVLDSTVDFLLKNPHLCIEISIHTDSRGNDKYNSELSKRRALAVKTYIDDKTKNTERTTSRGAGEYELINSDEFIRNNGKTKPEQELLHQKNRRTDLKITSIDYKKN